MATITANHYEMGEIAIRPDKKALKLFPFPAELINQRIREVLTGPSQEINQVIDYLLTGSGKMLRPRLVFLCASLYSHDPQLVMDMAAAVELVHLASLVHDDVIDASDCRRGQESLNSRFGNQSSVLTGDYLFATAFNLVNRYNQQEIMENLTSTIQTMCAGEIRQMQLAFDTMISEEDYLQKSYGKTACLFASCCKIGALSSSMPAHEVSALEEFGLCLGYAYQIIDDLLDFMSDRVKLGKPCGSDLREGNITLPAIYLLRDPCYGSWVQTIIDERLFNEASIEAVTDALIKSGAIDNCLNLTYSFIARGLERLDQLPSGPVRKEIMNMGKYLLENYYQSLRTELSIPEQELSSS
jgi:heptaprenyl diphosphate synthase